MIPHRLLLLVALAATLAAALLVFVEPADAGSTERFILDSAESLGGGELDGAMVESNGQVRVGAEVTRLGIEGVPLAYSLARGPDGSHYVGTGDEGRIYRVRGDDIAIFAETEQLLVTSLAIGDGTLYAGTLPDGQVIAIPLGGGESTTFAPPGGVEHVWSLAWHTGRQRLFAGTGPEGRVVSYDPQGRAETYFDSDQEHVMAVALGEGDELFAGTNGDAIVYRVRAAGQAEVVYDFPGTEVTAIAFREGTLAVVANEMPAPRRVVSKNSSASSNASSAPRPGKGRLWRVDRDGRTERLHHDDEAHFTSVAIDSAGVIYAGGGKEGRVFLVRPDGTHATWVDVDARQVLAIDLSGERPVFVSGDGAAIYRVTGNAPRDARWTSKALDAKFIARWGQLVWRGSGAMQLQTRSGNSAEPDETWSDWSAPVSSPGPVRSPASRFLQVRASLREPNAVLRAVHVYYLPQNQRATIAEVGLKAPSKNDGIPESTTDYELRWEVENPDDDPLRFRLRYRGEDQRTWRPVFREDVRLTKNAYTWDTSGVPDGYYVVQVEASDEEANPAPLVLRSTAESEPILIDNDPPRIEGLAVRGGELVGRVLDGMGPIRRLEMRIDAAEWRPIFPEDLLLDEAVEALGVRLPELPEGEHVIAVRATDAGGNEVTAEITTRSR